VTDSDGTISVDSSALKRSGVNLDQLSADVDRIRDELGYHMASAAYAGGAGDTFAKLWDENVKPGLAAAHEVLAGLSGLIAVKGGKVVGAGDTYYSGDSTAENIASSGVHKR
jgi:hypothetical protein